MDKRTVSSAHSRIDDLNITFASLRTEVTIQHKELFTRVKRRDADDCTNKNGIKL